MGKQETQPYGKYRTSFGNALSPSPEADPPKARGRKRADPRQMLNGIIFRLRSGCQWNRLRWRRQRPFQRWVERGVLRRMWGALIEGCEELGGVD